MRLAASKLPPLVLLERERGLALELEQELAPVQVLELEQELAPVPVLEPEPVLALVPALGQVRHNWQQLNYLSTLLPSSALGLIFSSFSPPLKILEPSYAGIFSVESYHLL
jgi:hypothetical protein